MVEVAERVGRAIGRASRGGWHPWTCLDWSVVDVAPEIEFVPSEFGSLGRIGPENNRYPIRHTPLERLVDLLDRIGDPNGTPMWVGGRPGYEFKHVLSGPRPDPPERMNIAGGPVEARGIEFVFHRSDPDAREIVVGDCGLPLSILSDGWHHVFGSVWAVSVVTPGKYLGVELPAEAFSDMVLT